MVAAKTPAISAVLAAANEALFARERFVRRGRDGSDLESEFTLKKED
jgi:hypothetical protein